MKSIHALLGISRMRAWQTNQLARGLFAVLLVLSLIISLDRPAQAAANPWPGLEPGTYKPGEVVVKFRDTTGPLLASGQSWQPESLLAAPQTQSFGLASPKALEGRPGAYRFKANASADISQLITALSLDPRVEWAEPNLLRSIGRTPNDPLYNRVYKDANDNDQFRQWYLRQIGIERLWDVTTGNNQVIAVLDTGINPFHEELNGKVIIDRAFDITRGRFMTTTQNWDDEGHGTAVAGVIAARTDNKAGIAGINWNSLLLPVKVADANGSITSVDLSLGVVYATDNQARIINLSLGGSGISKLEQGSLEYAQSKGVLIVASAGNDPDTKPTYPAAYSNVIAVGASDRNDKVASFSSNSSYISVVAPGVDIFTSYCDFLSFPNIDQPRPDPSTVVNPQFSGYFYDPGTARVYRGNTSQPDCANPNPVRYPGPPVRCNINDLNSCVYSSPPALNNSVGTITPPSRMYLYISGTSFSAPIVTGLASLVVAVRPDISNEQIKSLLEATAVDIDVPGRDTRTGYGRVDAAALADALASGNISVNRASVLQGQVTGANLADVTVNLDPPNQTQNPNSSGGFRFEGLGANVYSLRVAVPKRGIVLGPVLVYPNGKEGNVLNVNFDVASGKIICGDGTRCPGNQTGAPGQPPGPPPPPPPPGPPLAPQSVSFIPTGPQPGSLFFAETGHNLSGGFRTFWERNGGLALFGFPLSEEFIETSATDGRIYIVQYFQRNRFEFHPENADPNKVLLGLLGNELTRGRNFPTGTPIPNTAGSQFFPETQHSSTDRFLAYWKANGGLPIFGYPISEPIQEGPYLVQYYERNRFEFHPENADPRYQVLLGLLGTDLARTRNYIR